MTKDLILTDGSIEKVPAEFYEFLSQVEWRPLHMKSNKGKYVLITGIGLPPEQGRIRPGFLRNVIRNLIILQKSNPDMLARILEEGTMSPMLFYAAAAPFWKPPEETK